MTMLYTAIKELAIDHVTSTILRPKLGFSSEVYAENGMIMDYPEICFEVVHALEAYGPMPHIELVLESITRLKDPAFSMKVMKAQVMLQAIAYYKACPLDSQGMRTIPVRQSTRYEIPPALVQAEKDMRETVDIGKIIPALDSKSEELPGFLRTKSVGD